MLVENVLMCPKCHHALERKEHSFICSNNHCYDISKEKYVNLLLCNQKKSKTPGDDKIMIAARDHFLKKGYFDLLRNNIETIVRNYNPQFILDAGCGTGYYTYNLEKEYNVVAIDISKDAARCTAKNNKNSLVLVSSIFETPLKEKSIDLILNVFAPKPKEEFKRILNKEGIIIEVVPGKEHLKELKEIIFKEKSALNEEKFAFQNFKLKNSMRVTYPIKIDDFCDIVNLIKMTPYYYTGGEKGLYRLDNINELTITLDFILNVWEFDSNI